MALVPATGQIIIFRAEEFGIHLMQLSHSCQNDKCYKTFSCATIALAKIARPPSWWDTARCSNGTVHFKNVNNCLNTHINSYLETSGGQNYNLYLIVV